MLTYILLILIFLWLFGYLSIPLTRIVLFSIFGRAITLNYPLLFLIILWLIDILPYPFRGFALVLFLLWILSVLGVIVISGLSNILLLAIIIGLIVYIFRR